MFPPPADGLGKRRSWKVYAPLCILVGYHERLGCSVGMLSFTMACPLPPPPLAYSFDCFRLGLSRAKTLLRVSISLFQSIQQRQPLPQNTPTIHNNAQHRRYMETSPFQARRQVYRSETHHSLTNAMCVFFPGTRGCGLKHNCCSL